MIPTAEYRCNEERHYMDRQQRDDQQKRHQTLLGNAQALLRLGDADSTSEAIEQFARLAAAGYMPASDALLHEVRYGHLALVPIRRLLSDPAEIDDALQTTLMVLSEKISTFKGDAKFSTWLYRIASNEAQMVIRRRNRKAEPISDQVPETGLSAQRLSSMVADEQTVQAAFKQLTPDHQEILRLREVVGMSYQDIAAKLGVPIGTVRGRLSRARKSLWELLINQESSPYYDPPDHPQPEQDQ